MAMSKELVIAAVGITEEQAAHLRLLIRKVAKQVPEKWRWGTEIKADLLVVDPNNFAGHMAQTRAQASGTRCAILCDEEFPAPDGLVLREPLKAENVISVLRQASTPSVQAAAVGAAGEDFYFRDLADFRSEAPSTARDDWGQRPPASALDDLAAIDMPIHNPVAEGLEALIKAERQRAEAPAVKRIQLSADTGIAATASPSRRAQNRIADSGGKPVLSVDNPNIRRILEVDDSEHSIRDYLDGDRAIITPSQIQAPEAPALTLDPKNQVFHAAGGLSRLIPYCSRVLPAKDWKMVTTRELTQLRENEPARPYSELVWLQTLLRSSGRLNDRLDPGGTYRLKGQVSAEPEFRDHGAIVRQMTDKPARLNEIAADAGASMDAVFNLVNAYEAIGLIEWTPRQRRHDPLPEDERKSGLLGKLGWPFGKKSS
jgi:hypothetical protein